MLALIQTYFLIESVRILAERLLQWEIVPPTEYS